MKKVYFFSDSCSGQNRNTNILATLWYIVNTTCIESIEHNFCVMLRVTQKMKVIRFIHALAGQVEIYQSIALHSGQL